MPEIQNISWLYFSLLVITFFMWCNFSQLSPAQFPCTVLLDPECMTSSCTSNHHPCHQVNDFWHRISFLILDVMRHLPALRVPEYCPLPEHEFLGSDICSDRVTWTQSRAVFCFDPLWNTGDTGVVATE